MEHKNGINSEFFPNDEFDQMIEEKTRGWKNTSPEQTVSEITDSLELAQSKESAESAEDQSSVASLSTEIPEDTIASQSTDAVGAAKLAEADSRVEQRVEQTEDSDSEDTDDEETPSVNQLPSDPKFTQSILEGRVAGSRLQNTKIRGIQTGPWAHPVVATETISQEEALENIGHPALADLWRKATQAAKNCKNESGRLDADKLIHHIGLLHKAAFYIDMVKYTYEAALKLAIETGTEAERAKAETAYAKMFAENARRVRPDGESKGKRAAKSTDDTPKPQKPKAPKKETLLKNVEISINVLINLGLKQDGIIERLKMAGKLNTPALEYIKEHAKA